MLSEYSECDNSNVSASAPARVGALIFLGSFYVFSGFCVDNDAVSLVYK